MHLGLRNYSLKRIIEHLDNNDFDRCWLLTWEDTKPGKWPTINLTVEDVYEAYSRYPDRITPMYAPDPRRPDASERLCHWREQGIMGCGELKVPLNWASDEVRRLLSTVSDFGMPLTFHMQASEYFLAPLNIRDRLIVKFLNSDRPINITKNVFELLKNRIAYLERWERKRRLLFPGYMLDFASLESALIDFPNVNFIGHGPFFWQNLVPQKVTDKNRSFGFVESTPLPALRLLQDYSNLYADISASAIWELQKNPVFARDLMETFNKKIIFGSDNMFVGAVEFIKSLDLDSLHLKNIYGLNALRLTEKN